VTVLHFVSSMLGVFLEYLDGKSVVFLGKLSSIRQVFCSGEALAPAHVQRFNDILGSINGASLANLYGPIEATIDVTFFDCSFHNTFDRIPIGRLIDNIKLSVIKDGGAAAIGEAGELCIVGVGLVCGYLNNFGLTREKF